MRLEVITAFTQDIYSFSANFLKESYRTLLARDEKRDVDRLPRTDTSKFYKILDRSHVYDKSPKKKSAPKIQSPAKKLDSSRNDLDKLNKEIALAKKLKELEKLEELIQNKQQASLDDPMEIDSEEEA